MSNRPLLIVGALLIAIGWCMDIMSLGWSEFARMEIVSAAIVLSLFGIVYLARKTWRR